MIKIEGVSHGIRNQPILADIDLTLPKGGITALIGPNGAGKSTLLSLIARLAPLQTGRVSVDELDVTRCDTRALSQRLAILPQSQDIAPRLSVRDLVSFGRYPHSRGRLTPEDEAEVTGAIARFGLDALENRAIDTLSGGQRQKALLAMIFAQGTDYVLLDEPLNNLDIAGSRELMAHLRHAADEQDRSFVIVLHDIAYALAYADHVVMLAGGRLVAAGPAREVITEERIFDVYGTRARLHKAGERLLVDVGMD